MWIPEGKRPFERYRHRWKVNIKRDIKKILARRVEDS
jgi:hypothetical protein